MNVAIRSALLWALVGTVAGWYSGKFDVDPKGNNGWLVGIPFALVLLAAIAGMVNGRKAFGAGHGISGILCGCVVGLILGSVASFLVVLVGRIGEFIPYLRKADARIFWTLGGCLIGALAGFCQAAFWRQDATDFRPDG